MEEEILEFVFYLFIFAGAVIAFIDRSKISKLVENNAKLDKIINFQAAQIEKLKRTIKELGSESQSQSQAPAVSKQDLINNLKAELAPEQKESDTFVNNTQEDSIALSKINSDSRITSSSGSPKTKATAWETQRLRLTASENKQEQQVVVDAPSLSFDDLLKGNALLWLGAIVLGLGGIFLAKYSIEAGLLPPVVRVIAGALFGIGLIVGAEYLNRHKERFNINTPTISASLASGGIITCFAMTLVSYDFYQFISTNVAFVLLAIIALSSTYLALRFGPILAGIGIVGAYAVPALLSNGSGNVFALLLYVAFVSLSAIWVAETVKQKWLWWLSFTGHIAWFFAAIAISGASYFATLLSFAVFTIYLFVLTGLIGWTLQKSVSNVFSLKQLLMPRKEQVAVLLPVLSIVIALLITPTQSHIFWANIIIASVLCAAAFRHSALDSWPFLALGFALCTYLLLPEPMSYDDNFFPFNGGYLFIQIATLVGMLFSVYMIKRFAERVSYLILLVVTPLALFGISYILSAPQAVTYLYPVWATELLLIGAASSYFSSKTDVAIQKVTLLVLANTTIALCCTMLLDASAFTLVLAAQVASMSYLSWKYKVVIPDWLYKAALIVVVSRLTFAPWLAEYKDELIFNVHWTLIVYPLILAVVWFAAKYNPSKSLKIWFSGILLHITALLITTETSYQLIGDYPNFIDLSFKESILLALNWLALAGVYLWRSKLSSSMAKVYQWAAIVLMAGTALMHLNISLINNPFFESQLTGDGIFNWLIIMWAIPAAILCLFVHFKLVPKEQYKFVYGVIATFIFLFINGEIRSVFNQGQLLWISPLQQAELYTYSIVWLVIATAAIFFAQYKGSTQIRNLGFACLALVILKVFVVDMSSLDGLYRAISFIGLGLCLVGIGWLFQKLQFNNELNKDKVLADNTNS